jgi:MYXO-CTERM domain-containing protein
MIGRRARRFAIAIVLVVAAWQRTAEARSTFVVHNLDAPGTGFNDTTPASPVAGNPGTTVGAQRLAAFKEAANTWAAALDSRVPIVIDARFAPLQCDGGRIVLGQARTTGLEADRPGLPPGTYFPEALADRIAEVDLNPGEADIEATFNGDVLGCSGGLEDWYYGFDGKPPRDDIDLVFVVMHELAHGLGFSSYVDDDTGALAGGLIDTFSAHIFDNDAGRAWTAMSNLQRAASATNFRHLVWNGANVSKVAPLVLAKGAPRIRVTPTPIGFSGAISEASFGELLAAGGAVAGLLRVGNPIDGCAPPPNYNDAIVLFAGGYCPSVQKAALAETGGAAAVLISDPEGIAPPSSIEVPFDQEAAFPVHVPVIGITNADAILLASGSSFSVSVDAEAARLVGTDEQGRMYLYASDPILPGSTVSHWDPIARPNLLQEPSASIDASHDIRLEVALMRDIGWAPFCGNGRLDPDEACDSGANNSDTAPGACRSTCVNAACGDGVSDPGEECDQGANNSDTTGGACRTTCKSAACGDHVMDPGETCDEGINNSDSMPGACRSTCLKAACGDGVVDMGEACDDGPNNGPGAACTTDCKRPPSDKGCGCGVVSDAHASGGVAALLAGMLVTLRRRRRDRR